MGRLERLWAYLTEPKVYWRLFSLLLAVIFWLLAAADGGLGGTERVVPVSVEVHNLPGHLILLEPPQRVGVRVRGLAPVLERGENLITARINLTGALEGTETYPVEVEVPFGVEVLGVTPPLVSVYTEEVQQKVFAVSLALSGLDPAAQIPGFVLQPSLVTVRGPRSILGKVDHLVAYHNLSSGSAQLEGSFPVQALDSGGRSVELVQIEPPEIRVRAERTAPQTE